MEQRLRHLQPKSMTMLSPIPVVILGTHVDFGPGIHDNSEKRFPPFFLVATGENGQKSFKLLR